MISPSPLMVDRNFVIVRGRRRVFFGGCDYLRLSSDPRIHRALMRGLREFGLNVAASRTTTGNHPIYGQLESALARFFGCEAATLLVDGYAAPATVAQAQAGRFSHVLIDERSHGCLRDAAPMFAGRVLPFRHRDTDSMERVWKWSGRPARTILLTDGVFAHDGSLAPLQEYLRILPRESWLLVDDAHGAGVLGATGRGTLEELGVSRRRIVQTVTLSKAFGVYGGAVLGPRSLQKSIVERSGFFVGTTPLPLPLACAALESLRLMRCDPSIRERLRRNVGRVKSALEVAGFPVVKTEFPVVALVPSAAGEGTRLERRLLRAGVWPPLLRYPGSPDGGYYRFVISSQHTPAQLDLLVEALLDHQVRERERSAKGIQHR